MTKKIIASTIIAGASILMAENVSTPVHGQKATMMEGVKYIKILGKTLKQNVGKRLKEDPTGLKAVIFCSENASKVAQKVSANFPKNIKVRRTALKYRNPDNKPDGTDIKTMNGIVSAIKAGTFDKKPVVVKMPNGTTRVYAPIMMETACLKCHGNASKINPKVMDVIRKKYPEDKATGFALHAFRGVAVAEISPKEK